MHLKMNTSSISESIRNNLKSTVVVNILKNYICWNAFDKEVIQHKKFFKGHKNKLTSEVSYFSFQDKTLPLEAGWRFRVQWDISL